MRTLIDLIKLNEDIADVRAKIDDKLDKIPDEEDLTDVLKFANRYTIKKDVFDFTSARQYKDIVSNTLLKALADAGINDEEVRKFLDKLSKDGILDEKLLLTPKAIHNFNSIIAAEYREIFDKVKVDLYKDIAGKIGETGDVGKGEYLLDIMSPHINRRGAPGDLDVSGTKIELKAGENGRLGPAGSQSLVGRFQREFVPMLKQLMPDADYTKLDPKKFNPTLTKMHQFSAFFDSADKVKKALSFMLHMHYPDYDTDSIANHVVDGSGNINGLNLKKEMLKASFTVYKKEKEFDGILIMDAEVTKFLYISSPEDMAASSELVNCSYPSWVDTQSNAMKLTLRAAAGVDVLASPISPKTQSTAQAATKKLAMLDQPMQGLRPPGTETTPRAAREIPREKR